MADIKLILAKSLFAASVLLLAACSGVREWQKEEGVVWATTYHITYSAPRPLTDTILAEMRRVEMSLSPFQQGSLISAVNRGERVAADSLLIRVLEASKRINSLSGGMFDPSVGPLVELWGFGTDKSVEAAPSDSAIARALQLVGIGRFTIAGDGTLQLPSPGAMLNFSAITKGLGCDAVAAALRRNGVDDYLVEIGGEIAMSGTNPSGEKWHISVDRPVDSLQRSGATIVELTDCGVATSGNYRNYRSYGGDKPVGHTIDPRTGRPAQRRTLSATVIAPDCMTADALATASMAMHPDSALRMVEALHGCELLLILPGDTLLHTSAFPL